MQDRAIVNVDLEFLLTLFRFIIPSLVINLFVRSLDGWTIHPHILTKTTLVKVH